MGLLCTLALLALGQQGPVLSNDVNVFIPRSSIDRPADRGKRAHTNYGIWIGPRQCPLPFSRPGPSALLTTPPDGFTPAQLQVAYGDSGGGSGIIAIVDAFDDPNALNDFNVFSSEFGLPTESSTNPTAATNSHFQVVYQGGVRPPVDPYDGGWEGEVAIDIELAHAMAPNAKIVLIETADDSFDNLLAGVDAAVALNARETSMSWIGDEFSGETGYDAHFKVPGHSFFAASGDVGGVVGYPSTSPWVISCGGTSLFLTDGVYGSELPWGSGGGGPSTIEPVPGFQKKLTSYDANGNRIALTGRGTPDISAVANWATGVACYNSYGGGGWFVAGGTSASAPILAGIQNVTTGIRHSVELLYVYSHPTKFHDLAVNGNGYAAGPGYDYANGLGSPRSQMSL